MTLPSPPHRSLTDDVLNVSQPEFGQRLRQLRLSRKMSQRTLAGTQVTSSYISLLEAGQRVPTLNVALALARRLETPLEALLGEHAHLLVAAPEQQESPWLAQIHANDAADFGDHEQARKFLMDALENARRDGNQEHFVQLGMSLQDVLNALNDHQARLALLTDMLEISLVKDAPATEMSLMITKASALRDAGDLVAARETAMAAMAHTTDPAIVGTIEHIRLLGVLVSVLCELRETDQVRPLVAEMLSLADAVGRPSVIGRAKWAASMAYATVGDQEDAHRNLRAALETLAHPSMSLRDWLRFSRAVVSTLLDLERDLDLAHEWLLNAEAAARAVNLLRDRATVMALRARYQLLTGDAEGALRIYEELDKDEPSFPALALAQVRIGRATALQRLGRTTEAATFLRGAADQCERSGAYQMAVQLWRQIDEMTRPDAKS